jgi:hypothetical protein
MLDKLPQTLIKAVPIGAERQNLLNFILSLSIGTGSGDHAAFKTYGWLPNHQGMAKGLTSKPLIGCGR